MAPSRMGSRTIAAPAATWRYRDLLIVIALAFISMILWRVPWIGTVFYPFRLLGTFVHELSHGLAAIATGGQFQRFAVNPDLSGIAWSAGGIRWVITSAGYVGSALVGGALLVATARGVPARSVLAMLGLSLGVLCVIFVRNPFGIASGLMLAGALIVAAERLSPFAAYALLLFLAVQLTLDAVNNMVDLIMLSAHHHEVLTDARLMALQTGIPALVWAMVWSAVAIVILAGALRIAFYGHALH